MSTFSMLKFNKGGMFMFIGRPKGTKNVMRTPEEKIEIINDYYSGTGIMEIERKYNISDSLFYKWKSEYEEYGIEGLKSNSGKHKNPNSGLHLRKPKNRIEELELELLKKDIEIARLKKGYMVKGVGQEKEFVTTFNKNIK